MKSKGILVISLFVFLLGCTVLSNAASITFSIGDLAPGVEIFMFKLKGPGFEPKAIVNEIKPGSWTYAKTTETYQVYDFSSLSTGIKNPITGEFLTLDFGDSLDDLATPPFSKQNFVFGGYETGVYYDLSMAYSLDPEINHATYTFSSVPIPATAILFLSGIFGLVGIRKFKAGKRKS